MVGVMAGRTCVVGAMAGRTCVVGAMAGGTQQHLALVAATDARLLFASQLCRPVDGVTVRRDAVLVRPCALRHHVLNGGLYEPL